MGKLIIFSFLLIIAAVSCSKTEPPPTKPPAPKPEITLAQEDASVIEAWIKITTNNIQLPAEVTLKKNNTVEQTISLLTQDSIIYIDSLLPKTNYSFQAFIHTNTQTYESNELSVETMDTTSHNFTFQSWTFGTIGSSTLYDVAIIDENNIWAVGEIFMNDSLGNPDPHVYNAVHWDGQEWKLYRIMFYSICGQSHRTPYPAKSIFVFNKTDIWIAMDGDQIARLNDTTQTNIMCLPFSFVINKLWGSSDNDMYAVGNNGNIAHYTNGLWTKIESGTDLNINDIWGDYNEKAGEWEILAVASNILQGFEKEVIKINENSAEVLSKEGIDETLSSVWFKSNRKYYVAGSGIYEKSNLNEETWKGDPLDITNYFIYKFRGVSLNDIVAAGGVGEVLHFNGSTWKSYFEEAGLNYGNYYSIFIKGNTIAVVGVDAPKAAITIGTRQ